MATPKRKRSLLSKIVRWTLGTLAFLVLLGALLIYLFQDKIKEMALRELGKRLNAEITVSSSSVSFFTYWPNVAVTLSDLKVNPRDNKPKGDVVQVKTAVFRINFWSLFSSQYKLSGITLDQPHIWMEQEYNGKWNFGSLFQPQSGESGESGSEVVVELKKLEIVNGKIDYLSKANQTETHWDSLSLNLAGKFSGSKSTFVTDLGFTLSELTVSSFPVLTSRPVTAKLNINLDQTGKMVWTIDSSRLKIAGVDFGLNGTIKQQDSSYAIDLAYASRTNTFESFVSLLPGQWLDLGKPYKHRGQFRMSGWLKGEAGNGNAPDFFAEYKVDKGFFQYDGYKGSISDLNMNGSWLINNKVPALSHFRINELRGTLNDHEIKGSFEYKNFLEPRLKFGLHGQLTLEDIRGFYPSFADSVNMSGKLWTDIEASGLLADFKANHYKAILADGNFDFENLNISHPGLTHRAESLSGKLDVDNGQIRIEALNGRLGKSDFDITGTITEYLPWLLDSAGLLTAKLILSSGTLDLNEWFAAAPVANAEKTESPGTYNLSFPAYIDFNLQAKVGHFTLDKFKANNLKADCRIKENRLTINSLSMEAMKGNVKLNGTIDMLGDAAAFDVTVTPTEIDINQTFHTFDQLAAFALVKENLSGSFSGTQKIKGRLNNLLELDPASLTANGNILLEESRLVNFEPLQAMAGFVKLEKLKDVKFSTIKTDYKIENERFYILDKMKVNANDYKLTISGSHGFDNSLDYRVVIELPKKEAQKSSSSDVLGIIEEAKITDTRISIPVKVTGTVDNPKFRLDMKVMGKRIEDKLGQQGEELKEAKDIEIEKTFGKQDTVKVDDLIIEEKDTTHRKTGKEFFDKFKNPFKPKGKK